MPKRSQKITFKDYAELDLLVRHRVWDESGIEKITFEVGEVRRMATYFDRLEAILRRISSTSDPVCIEHSRGVNLSVPGRLLWSALRDVDSEARASLCEGRRLNHWLKIGLHLARKWGPRLRPFARFNPNELHVTDPFPRRVMAHIAYVIRRVCTSTRFRNMVNNETRNAKENYLSCANLMIDLLAKDHRMLILRCDLYFEGDAKILSDSEAAEHAYDKFIDNLRKDRVVPDVLGYIGKRENGLERQIHFHILVAVDGDEHRSAYALTELLGAFWINECVGGELLASFFNCWVRRNEYEYPAVGMLHYMDSRMLMGLRLTLEYMCKEGAHILVGAGMGRNLRKSQSPRRIEQGARRGAPRKADRELSTARQVLLTMDTQEKELRATPVRAHSDSSPGRRVKR